MDTGLRFLTGGGDMRTNSAFSDRTSNKGEDNEHLRDPAGGGTEKGARDATARPGGTPVRSFTVSFNSTAAFASSVAEPWRTRTGKSSASVPTGSSERSMSKSWGFFSRSEGAANGS